MVIEPIDIIGIIMGVVFGLIAPAFVQFSLGKLFGGEVSFKSSISPRPIKTEFSDVREMTDRQIKMVSGFKLFVPIALFVYSQILDPPYDLLSYLLLSAIIFSTVTISWMDLLALENPTDWSLEATHMYSNETKNSSFFSSFFLSLRDRPATHISFLIFILIISLLAAEYIGIVNYIMDTNTPPYRVSTVGQVAGGVGTVLFSILLVISYDKQVSISDTQSFIQEEQKELMRRERQPKLSGPYNFVFWGAYPGNRPEPNLKAQCKNHKPNPNSLQFFQTNAGEGIAQNFRLYVKLRVDQGPHHGRVAVCAVQRTDRNPLHKFGESDIQGGEKDVEFITEELKLQFTTPNPNDFPESHTYKFRQGMKKLFSEGTVKVSLTLELEWEDEFEEKYQEQIYHTTSNITHRMGLTDIVYQP